MFGKNKQVGGIAFALLMVCVTPWTALSKGSDVQFHGTITRVDLANAATASITLRMVGLEVSVHVTTDTNVESQGDEGELSDVKVGDFVKVSGFFANSGITAREITILDRGDGEFRFRGLITAVRQAANGTLITVLGIELLVNADTNVERRGTGGPIAATVLAVNQNVDARGFNRDGQLIATRIKVGNREEDFIRVHFAGKITVVSTGRLTVDTEGGSSAIVLTGPTTLIIGTPAAGRFVEVHGTLNGSLEVVAARVIVRLNRDDDDAPPRPLTKFNKKVLLRPVGNVSSIFGQAEAEFQQKGQDIEQELEVDFKHALTNTDYSIRIDIAGFGSVSLPTVRTNRDGEAELKLKAPPRSGQTDLASLLPAGKTVRDITKVQILTAAGIVVAEGTF